MSDTSLPTSSVFIRYRIALLWTVITCAVLLFQTLTGVWSSDIGADPDEPAHAVTSLMVRDYLASGLAQSPMSFAQQYYEDFPKVALGHYPPGYYALTGLLLLPYPQPQVLFVLQAFLIGLLSVQVYLTGRRFLHELSALTASVLTASFPVTLKLSQLVMADLLLACLCFLAVEIWARFMDKPRVSLALLFGLVAASAILTKGSGLALALVPVVSIFGLRRWTSLKHPSFWLAGLPVAFLAGPWMLYSSKITKEGMVSASPIDFAWGAVKFYASSMHYTFGVVPMLLGVVGLMVWLGSKAFRDSQDTRRMAIWGMMLGTALIMLLIPTGYSTRYFMPIVPAVALLAVSLFDMLGIKTKISQWGLFLLIISLWLHFPVNGFPIKNVTGYRSAVFQALDRASHEFPDKWLVCADPRGEGAVIASAAFATPQRSPSSLRLYRGSKELASADWLGRNYKTAFDTPEALLAWLDKTGITRVFVDVYQGNAKPPPHEVLLLQALGNHAQWTIDRELPTTRPYQVGSGRLMVFRRVDL